MEYKISDYISVLFIKRKDLIEELRILNKRKGEDEYDDEYYKRQIENYQKMIVDIRSKIPYADKLEIPKHHSRWSNVFY